MHTISLVSSNILLRTAWQYLHLYQDRRPEPVDGECKPARSHDVHMVEG